MTHKILAIEVMEGGEAVNRYLAAIWKKSTGTKIRISYTYPLIGLSEETVFIKTETELFNSWPLLFLGGIGFDLLGFHIWAWCLWVSAGLSWFIFSATFPYIIMKYKLRNKARIKRLTLNEALNRSKGIW